VTNPVRPDEEIRSIDRISILYYFLGTKLLV
jgi:hypothetical protein